MFASAGYRLAQFGDIGFVYSDIDYRDRDRIRVASISSSARLSRAWSVTTAVSRVLTSSPSTSFSLSFVWNGDLYDTAVLGYQGSAGTGNRNDYGFARYSRRPDYNGGYGYDVEIASNQ